MKNALRSDLKAQECESKRGKSSGDARVILEICETDQAYKHHEYRKKHCSQLLTLSENLNEISQDYADRLATFGETPPDYSEIRMENL
ncbi:unnamed protein product [Adineta steineri]|uniref:Uncharacterized protein n=1 Tax=Adineta steineri TaxID=433720 RepID=A0A819HR42_9BILA|nr:unnamed protein product [Adineta steineri]